MAIRYIADDIFIYTFFNENIWNSIKIQLKFDPVIIDWCETGAHWAVNSTNDDTKLRCMYTPLSLNAFKLMVLKTIVQVHITDTTTPFVVVQ